DVPDATLPDYSRIQAFVIPSSQSLASGNAILGSVNSVFYSNGSSSLQIHFNANFTAGVEYQVAIINKNANLQSWSWRYYDYGNYPLDKFLAEITGDESAIEWIPQEYVLTVMSDRWKLVSQYRYNTVGGARVDFNDDYIPQNGFSDLDIRYGKISQKFSGELNGFLMANKSSSLSDDIYLQISEEGGDVVERILIQDDNLMKFSKQFLVASAPVIDRADYYTGTMTPQANVADASEYLAGRSWIYRMPYAYSSGFSNTSNTSVHNCSDLCPSVGGGSSWFYLYPSDAADSVPYDLTIRMILDGLSEEMAAEWESFSQYLNNKELLQWETYNGIFTTHTDVKESALNNAYVSNEPVFINGQPAYLRVVIDTQETIWMDGSPVNMQDYSLIFKDTFKDAMACNSSMPVPVSISMMDAESEALGNYCGDEIDISWDFSTNGTMVVEVSVALTTAMENGRHQKQILLLNRNNGESRILDVNFYVADQRIPVEEITDELVWLSAESRIYSGITQYSTTLSESLVSHGYELSSVDLIFPKDENWNFCHIEVEWYFLRFSGAYEEYKNCDVIYMENQKEYLFWNRAFEYIIQENDLVFSFEIIGDERSYQHTVDTSYIKENIRFNMELKNLTGDVLNYHVGQLVTEALGLDFDLNVPAVVTLMIDGQPADMSQYVYGRDSNDKELRVRVGRYGNFSPLLIPELWSLSAFTDEYFTSVIAF